jgi:orotate phosphoribosyltransferase
MLTIKDLMNFRLSRTARGWRYDNGHTYEELPSAEEVLEWFKILQAGWVHNGDPKKPHAKLHGGKCSTGFFLCKRVLSYGNLREILAACIIRELDIHPGAEINGVFGSPYSSILLAGDVARLLRVKVYVPEKDPDDLSKKRMIFKPDDPAPEGSVLLQIEELVTTWDSGSATAQAMTLGNPYPVKFAPSVGALIHRPPVINRELPDGRKLVPLIERQVDAWEPADCPLCKQGSIPVAPKGENWSKLTA